MSESGGKKRKGRRRLFQDEVVPGATPKPAEPRELGTPTSAALGGAPVPAARSRRTPTPVPPRRELMIPEPAGWDEEDEDTVDPPGMAMPPPPPGAAGDPRAADASEQPTDIVSPPIRPPDISDQDTEIVAPPPLGVLEDALNADNERSEEVLMFPSQTPPPVSRVGDDDDWFDSPTNETLPDEESEREQRAFAWVAIGAGVLIVGVSLAVVGALMIGWAVSTPSPEPPPPSLAAPPPPMPTPLPPQQPDPQPQPVDDTEAQLDDEAPDAGTDEPVDAPVDRPPTPAPPVRQPTAQPRPEPIDEPAAEAEPDDGAPSPWDTEAEEPAAEPQPEPEAEPEDDGSGLRMRNIFGRKKDK